MDFFEMLLESNESEQDDDIEFDDESYGSSTLSEVGWDF
jgi:hypothetical protein